MGKIVLSFLVASLLMLPVASHSSSFKPASSQGVSLNEVPALKSLDRKEIEKLIGRKLTLKERISLFVLKKFGGDANSKGQTAFIWSLVGAGLFVLGLFIPYIILASVVAAIVAVILGSSAKRQNPEDDKARTAVLLGWITLGLFALILIAAVIVVSTWGW